MKMVQILWETTLQGLSTHARDLASPGPDDGAVYDAILTEDERTK